MMTPVKRIEIMVSEPLVTHLVEILESHSFQAYCISTGHAGRSTSGIKMGGVSDTILTLIASPDEARLLLPALEQFVQRYGGIFTIIDAMGAYNR
jgi:hypothetical protein